MTMVALKDVKDQLADLLDEVAKGEEVFITREDGSSFKLVASPKRGGLGSAKGQVKLSKDFKDIPEGFEAYLVSQ